jgi:hypothetical protein
MTSNKQYIAIDIAKQTLQVQSDLKSLSLSYDRDGLKQLRTFIAQHQAPMVIAQATGRYERASAGSTRSLRNHPSSPNQNLIA